MKRDRQKSYSIKLYSCEIIEKFSIPKFLQHTKGTFNSPPPSKPLPVGELSNGWIPELLPFDRCHCPIFLEFKSRPLRDI